MQTTPTIHPAGLDLCETTVRRRPGALTWEYSSSIQLVDLPPATEVTQTDGTHAHDAALARAFTVPLVLDPHEDDFDGALERLRQSCAVAAPEIRASAELTARELAADTTLSRLMRGNVGSVDRIVFLENVWVHPSVRGLGIGSRIAAQTLYLAGAAECGALTIATTAPSGDVGSGDAAGRFLHSLGMTETATGLWAGLGAMDRPGGVLSELASS